MLLNENRVMQAHTYSSNIYLTLPFLNIYRMKHHRSGYNITHPTAMPSSVYPARQDIRSFRIYRHTHLMCVYCLQDYRWQSGFEKGFDLKRSKTHKWNHVDQEKLYIQIKGRTIFIIVAAPFHIYVWHEFILIFNIFRFT